MKRISLIALLGLLLLVSCEPITIGKKNTLVNVVELGLDIYGATEENMDKTLKRMNRLKSNYPKIIIPAIARPMAP